MTASVDESESMSLSALCTDHSKVTDGIFAPASKAVDERGIGCSAFEKLAQNNLLVPQELTAGVLSYASEQEHDTIPGAL